ncbi:uncharacterized protein LOC129948078 [Eupeodes corollae]|uniref:uncharacterized protein LOC129948078 n=1 Tax=Eupeodes corollae TaxID=290404 RepID=UPI0024908EC5|nr:uncharacterized protein LOC129948078 [Eupeodes corollae]
MVNSPPSNTKQPDAQISCQSCNDADNSQMVQCDECDGWHHFKCVGVNASIEDKDWKCKECHQKDLDNQGGTSSSNEQFEATQKNPICTSTRLPPADSGRNLQQTSFSPTASKQLNGNKNENPKLCVPARTKSNKSKSINSVKSLQLNLMRLEEERDLMKKRDREYLEAKYKLLEQQTDSESEDESTSSRVDKWINQQSITKNQVCPTLNHQSGSKQQLVPKSNTQELTRAINLNETWVGAYGSSMPAVNINTTTNRDSTIFQNPSTVHTLHNDDRGNDIIDQARGRPYLNTQQIATRHIVSKELPTFSGRPEEWPLFFSCFKSTTLACGFSDDENLIRLNRCLKGNALESVRAKLLYPNQVPSIIETLKMLFGRPESIIKTLISRLRQERPPRDDKLDTLVAFALSVQNIVATMEAAGLTSHLNNPCLMQELTDKLPFQTKLNWGVFKLNKQNIDLTTFSSWLFQVAQAACEVTDVSLLSKDVKPDKRRQPSNFHLNGHHDEAKNEFQCQDQQKHCVICKGACKSVENCDEFSGLSLNNRWKAVKKHFLCRTCLVNHNKRRCLSANRCGIMNCTYRHHKLLHKHEQPAARSENQNLSSYHCTHKHKGSLLFKILPVSLYNNDIKIEAFAFLDDGSSVTMMDNELADILKLKGEPQELRLRWTSGNSRTEEKSKKVNLMIAAKQSSKKYALTNIRTVESLNLPAQTINFNSLASCYHYLKGIPIQSFTDARPRILIGLDNANLLNSLKYREGRINQPSAIKTRLGWTIYGPCEEEGETSIDYQNYHLCECKEQADEKLHELVREFFSIESFGSKEIRKLTKDRDVRAENLLESSAKRLGKRFSVPLLWKSECHAFPNSRPSAERRLMCLEKRLHKEPELAANLDSQISDYLRQGYVRKLTSDDLQNYKGNRIWYLPIFPVLNPNKPSKVRMVWDAAAQVDGVSLNSMLLSGPDYLVSLIDILFRFRQRNIAICGDIKEMFHQVLVEEADQHAQRFLWRSKETGIIEDYAMNVLTFGATCSPYCADYVKNKNAMEHSEKFPRAAEAIIRNHYVDDFLDSFDTPEEAMRITNEVIYIHQQAGFEIRNFMSNCESVVAALGKNAADCAKPFKNRSSPYEFEKVLGMWWSPLTDQFSFLFNSKNFDKEILEGLFPPTKRIVLRVLMSTFDPLGLIGHFLMFLKILLQSIWRERINWDEPIHEAHFELWKKWLNLLPTIREIKIRRPYLNNLKFDAESTVELHVFVDASLSGFAAVCYLRVQRGTSIQCNLVCSKTKVASLKPISVPRMELEAAVLGVRLAQTVINGHSIQINRRYFWSDSQSVLCWIKNDNRKLKQFVTFRVGEILENSNENEWRWVPSEHNVADDATKWNLKVDFSSDSRWYRGPDFLYSPKDSWPLNPKEDTGNEIEVHTHIDVSVTPLQNYMQFSSWEETVTAVSYVFKYFCIFLQKFRKPDDCFDLGESKGTKSYLLWLCQDENGNLDYVKGAETYLYMICQSEGYPKEINALQNKQPIEKTSSLYQLSPYLDTKGVMRVKGRIDASNHVTLDCKRPVILPKQHHVTTLIVDNFHRKYKHIFFETAVNEIRQFFYIPTLRAVLKRVQNNCQECRNNRAMHVAPMMSDLPEARLKAFTRPFTYVGVDYFGPILVAVGRHTEKRWGVLFTCLTVRAIQIEIAHSLSSDSCILAIKRFCAKRGRPKQVWSDNGTNFRGASQELKTAIEELCTEDISKNLEKEKIEWKFIPPTSPHMGGSWERLIRSVKQVLAKMHIGRNPKDEVLLTMMAEVEFIINSRPLTYIPIDTDSDEALTPNHFLMGSSNGIRLTGELSSDGHTLRKHWLACEQYSNLFWKRWVKEYLPSLTRRTKWFEPAKPVSEGDIVLIVDEKNPRNTWPKGVILQANLSKDGQTRSAIVKTATGTYTRPVAKLAVLDVRRFGEDGNWKKPPAYQGGVLPNLAMP